MTFKILKGLFALIVIAGLAWLGWTIYQRVQLANAPTEETKRGPRVAPVQVADVEIGSISVRRVFSGSLEAPTAFVVAPKVSGRIERLTVDLADEITRGQVVAELDRAEYEQAVLQAKADLAVIKATLASARSAMEIADRELKRAESLFERGVTSESQLDSARADRLARVAEVDVAEAELARAQTAVGAAEIRLGYTTVSANWTGGVEKRVVAERFVNEGDTVSANTPMVTIVQLNPIHGVFYVTERDYGKLALNQLVEMTTDAYPGEIFKGTIRRIAPIFRQSSRQAKVEVEVPNDDQRLKPGMFIRATVVLETLENATIVPEMALANRDDQDGVFLVSEDGATVSWRPVKTGVKQDGRVQVVGDALQGRVVTLGQQLVDDGSAIVIPNGDAPASATGDENQATP